MAIDGVKIIDSDSAHDVYNQLMEMYHTGESIEKIKEKLNEFELTYTYCELEYEIFTTAYALAMWEIGQLSNEQLQSVKNIVSKGASRLWNDVHPNAQKERQRVLNRFLQKIEKPNLKILKRKKFKKLSNVLFSIGDVIAVTINNRYRCVIFEKFNQHRNDAYYSFVVTTYNSNVEPTIDDILLEEIPVTKKTNTGEFGIRSLDIYYKFIEKHKPDFLKVGTIYLDPKAENLGFSRQVHGLDDLIEMEKKINDILLGERAELHVCSDIMNLWCNEQNE